MLLVAGLLVTVVGLFQAAFMDVVAGLGMGFIGFCGIGIAWGFRHHLDQRSRSAEGQNDERDQVAAQLEETRAAIAGLATVGPEQVRAEQRPGTGRTPHR